MAELNNGRNGQEPTLALPVKLLPCFGCDFCRSFKVFSAMSDKIGITKSMTRCHGLD